MKEKFKIDKQANFFVFLGEISGIRNSAWNQERKKEWIILSNGKLNKKERVQINKFNEIFETANYDFIEALFFSFSKEKLQQELKENLSPDFLNILDKTYSLFNSRFNKLWIKKEKKLSMIKEGLEKNYFKLKEIIEIIEKISATKNMLLEKNPVQLVMSSKNKEDILGYFSAIGDEHLEIILECSNYLNKNGRIFLNLIIAHELFHFALNRNTKLKKLLKKISRKYEKILSELSSELPAEKILEELLISSFVPEGYISEYYFNQKVKKIEKFKNKKGVVNFVLLRQFCAYKMKDTTQKYIKNSKEIDDDYLLEIVKNF